MALSDSALCDLVASLQAGDGVDLVRELARWALQELIEAEATTAIGAGRSCCSSASLAASKRASRVARKAYSGSLARRTM